MYSSDEKNAPRPAARSLASRYMLFVPSYKMLFLCRRTASAAADTADWLATNRASLAIISANSLPGGPTPTLCAVWLLLSPPKIARLVGRRSRPRGGVLDGRRVSF